MKRGNRTVTVEGSHEIDGREIAYTADVRINYQPGRFSGPPEDCYPDESEVDIENLVTLPPGFEDKLDAEKIEDKAWESFHSGD